MTDVNVILVPQAAEPEVLVVQEGTPGRQGEPGEGLPEGGTTGQIATKASDDDFDVEWTDAPVALPPGGTDGQVLTKQSATDGDADWEDPTGGGGGASDWGDLGGDIQDQVDLWAELTARQPLDGDLTAIAALATTAFGRSLLTLANAAALLAAAGAAAAVHTHAGEDIDSGTIADARIASTIARDSEVSAAIAALSSVYQPLDSDLTAIAALTTTSYGRAFLALADAAAGRTALGLGTAATANTGDFDAAGAAAAAQAASQPLDSDLTAIAALTTTAFGRSLLTLADAAALLAAAGAAAASHTHSGDDIVSGTVADARIASTIARDSEVSAAIAALSSVYQPLDSDLTAIAALTTTSFGRGFLVLADAAAALVALGLDADLATFAVPANTTVSTYMKSVLDDTDAATARGTLGLVIGTDVQAQSATLSLLAALTTTSIGRSLLEASDAAALRTILALGTIAIQNANNVTITGGSITGITDLAVADGGTGASSHTNHGVLLGQGTSAVVATSAGTAGQIFTSNGPSADPSFQALDPSSISNGSIITILARNILK